MVEGGLDKRINETIDTLDDGSLARRSRDG